MLLEIAVGDAYGACFEYDDPSPGRPNDLSGYPANRAYAAIGGGRYTDDAQMSVAVAETLLAGDLSREAFADAFVAAFRRDPRQGYSRGFQALIEECLDGAELLARVRPDSARSGAAMRACPLGLLPDEAEVLRVAELQARITHDTDGGVAAAQGAALMCFALRGGLCPRADLPRWLSERVPGPWGEAWHGPVGSLGMDSARAALTAVAGGTSLSGILRASVAFTGDVDTVAAIAMGAASCDPAVKRDLPEVLLLGLEDGAWGRTAIQALDAELSAGLPARDAVRPR